MFVLRLARSDFGLPFLPFFAPFSFFCFISVFHFDKRFEKIACHPRRYARLVFFFPLSLFFFITVEVSRTYAGDLEMKGMESSRFLPCH